MGGCFSVHTLIYIYSYVRTHAPRPVDGRVRDEEGAHGHAVHVVCVCASFEGVYHRTNQINACVSSINQPNPTKPANPSLPRQAFTIKLMPRSVCSLPVLVNPSIHQSINPSGGRLQKHATHPPRTRAGARRD